MKKRLLLCAMLMMLIVAGCTSRGIAMPVTPPQATMPTGGDTPVSSDDAAPLPSTDLVVTGPVDGAEVEAELLILESYPPQFMLVLKGTSPTPCHQALVNLSLVVYRDEPNTPNEIHLDAVFAADPEEMCIQVLGEFSTSINLGSFPEGETFTVWVNGVQVAEFTA